MSNSHPLVQMERLRSQGEEYNSPGPQRVDIPGSDMVAFVLINSIGFKSQRLHFPSV